MGASDYSKEMLLEWYILRIMQWEELLSSKRAIPFELKWDGVWVTGFIFLIYKIVNKNVFFQLSFQSERNLKTYIELLSVRLIAKHESFSFIWKKLVGFSAKTSSTAKQNPQKINYINIWEVKWAVRELFVDHKISFCGTMFYRRSGKV